MCSFEFKHNIGQTGEQEPLWIKGNQRPRTHMTNHRTLVWTKVETEIVKEIEVPQAALGTPVPGTGNSLHSPVAEEVGVPAPAPGLLQVTERRQPLSSVSSLEVHFDLLDLTELTDMSDQELAEVFADSDDENLTSDSPAGSTALGPELTGLRNGKGATGAVGGPEPSSLPAHNPCRLESWASAAPGPSCGHQIIPSPRCTQTHRPTPAASGQLSALPILDPHQG
uniref:Dysbindin domain-containing protein 1 n=1 Tax=Camelus bactrianus TaxID=9837 RepID=A0A9W3FLA4_CAMBA|nr:dysbindin domain-containing protein 1 isoform X1 [Camelus bactrianus]